MESKETNTGKQVSSETIAMCAVRCACACFELFQIRFSSLLTRLCTFFVQVCLKDITLKRTYVKPENNHDYLTTDLVVVEASEPLRDALSQMNKYQLSALPVVRRANSPDHFLGFLDMQAVCVYIATVFPTPANGEQVAQAAAAAAAMFDAPVGAILDSRVCKPKHTDTQLWSILETFQHIRRLPLFDSQKTSFRGICSQSDCVSFFTDQFAHHPVWKEAGKKKISDFWGQRSCGRASNPKLLYIPPTMPTIDAVKRLAATGARALAIVSGNGNIIGHFSEKDVARVMELAANKERPANDAGAHTAGNREKVFQHLLEPVSTFCQIGKAGRTKPAVVTITSSIYPVCKVITDNHYYEVWVVDGNGKVLGCLTLGDICRIVYRQCREHQLQTRTQTTSSSTLAQLPSQNSSSTIAQPPIQCPNHIQLPADKKRKSPSSLFEDVDFNAQRAS